jgi:hypothetical protein
MPARVNPGPELWLSRIIEDESVGTVLAPSDRHHLIAIARKAFEVRAHQREYFKSRSNDALAASKVAEKELDMLLTRPLQGGLDL